MSILKTNLSCFKQNGLYNFDDTLLNIFHQSQKMKDYHKAQQELRRRSPDIFGKDKAAVWDYTDGNAYRLNYYKTTGQLKPDDRNDTLFYDILDKELREALVKIPDTEGVFYRQVGFGLSDSKFFNSSREDFLQFAKYHENNKGGIIKYPSYLSTTLVESSYTTTDAPYRGAFLIYGKHGKIIDNYSTVPREYEALFVPNTPFKVHDFEWISKDLFASILSEV